MGFGRALATQFFQCPTQFTKCKTGLECPFPVDEACGWYGRMRLRPMWRAHGAGERCSAELRCEEFGYLVHELLEGKRQEEERVLEVPDSGHCVYSFPNAHDA